MVSACVKPLGIYPLQIFPLRYFILFLWTAGEFLVSFFDVENYDVTT